MNTGTLPFAEAEDIKHIFVVEDEAPIRILITRILENAYYKVTAFENSETFFKHLNSTTILPDLIILDIILPDASGMDILQNLKARKNTMDISILMLTGEQDVELIKNAYHSGAADYLLKPVQPNLLTERVKFNLSLRFELSDIHYLVSRLHHEEPNLLNGHGLRDFPKHKIRCYSVNYQSTPLCVIIPIEFRPKSFVNANIEVLKKSVRIFKNNNIRWNQIWPTRSLQIDFAHDPSFKINADENKAKVEAQKKLEETEKKVRLENALPLTLSSFMSKDFIDFKKEAFGKIPTIGTSFWKSLLKWSEDKNICEKEIEFWKEKTKTFATKRGEWE